MKRLGLFSALPIIALIVLSLSGCGKNNVFSWAHTPGSSSDPQALSSDAYTALLNKDYTKALEYYQKLIEANPASAEAIYGQAAAELGVAGLDIAGLVSNLIRQQPYSSISRLAQAVGYSANYVIPSTSDPLLPDTIINNSQAIWAAVNNVLADDQLKRILRGETDGRIRPDNPEVNLNVAFCLVLRAALRLKIYDLVDVHSDYTATIRTTNSADLEREARRSVEDIISAYWRLYDVADKLNLERDASINKINDDVRDLSDDLKKKVRESGLGVNIDGVNLNYDYYQGVSR